MSKAVEVRGRRMAHQGRGKTTIRSGDAPARRDEGRAAPSPSPDGAAAAPGT